MNIGLSNMCTHVGRNSSYDNLHMFFKSFKSAFLVMTPLHSEECTEEEEVANSRRWVCNFTVLNSCSWLYFQLLQELFKSVKLHCLYFIIFPQSSKFWPLIQQNSLIFPGVCRFLFPFKKQRNVKKEASRQ